MSIRLEEYKDRVHFKGRSKREYVKTKVTESIMSLIEDSQYGFTIDVYDKTNKTYSSHDVAILSTKTTQEYEAANIIAPLEVGLDKGTIFKWDGYNWIVLKKMFRPEQPGFNGIAYRCTGELKWIDDDGILHVQPAYMRSGRITNALGVTPDVNRVFDNIVMHDTDWNMMAATQQPNPLPLLHPEMRFVIKGQSYRVTNVDNVSIDNVSILSLVDDKTLDLFESQYVIPNGISYNSYVIMDEKITIMDTVDGRKTDEWLENLAVVLRDKEPSYLVVSHMEPDHAANIKLLADKYPNMKVVGNAKTFAMIPQFFQIDLSMYTVLRQFLKPFFLYHLHTVS